MLQDFILAFHRPSVEWRGFPPPVLAQPQAEVSSVFALRASGATSARASVPALLCAAAGASSLGRRTRGPPDTREPSWHVQAGIRSTVNPYSLSASLTVAELTMRMHHASRLSALGTLVAAHRYGHRAGLSHTSGIGTLTQSLRRLYERARVPRVHAVARITPPREPSSPARPASPRPPSAPQTRRAWQSRPSSARRASRTTGRRGP